MPLFRLFRFALCAVLFCALVASRAAAQEIAADATTYIDARDIGPSQPATVLQSVTPIVIPSSGKASAFPVRLMLSGFTTNINTLKVRLDGLTHTSPEDLDILLVSPNNKRIFLMSDTGGGTDVTDMTLIFQGNSGALSSAPLTFGSHAPTDLEPGDVLPSPAPGGPYWTLSEFQGDTPNGEWKLYVFDDKDGDGGSLDGFSLIITPQYDNNVTVPIPDQSSVVSQIAVSGVGFINKVTVSLHIEHTATTDLDVSLEGPDGTTVILTNDHGSGGDNYGSSCTQAERTTFDDSASPIGSASPPFVGTYQPDGFLGSFAGKSGAAANGTWKLHITDDAAVDTGALLCWSLRIDYNDATQSIEAPVGLRVASIVGDQVTLRWLGPYTGKTPTQYLVEGGAVPGQTIATLPTGSKDPIVTFRAPTGSFYVRVRGEGNGVVGPVSNEIPLHVNVPVAPSAPAILQGVSTGSLVGLAWRNTFGGSAPTSLLLEVNGSAQASIPLSVNDALSFTGVPPGNYTLQVRGVNAGGVGPPSEPLSFSIPTIGCVEAPGTPIRLLPYMVGGTLHLIWEPAMSLGAPTSYLLNVSGAFTGSFPLTTRSVSGTVGPGSYTFQVAATNACGTSGAASRTITIP